MVERANSDAMRPSTRTTSFEVSLRDAVVAAMLPAPGGALRAASEVDLRAFFDRFDRVAPTHLRVGFRAAVWAVGFVLPRVLGEGRSLDALDPDARDRVLVRGAEMAGFAELLDIVKVVVCMGYFADAAVQATVRGPT